MRLGPGKLAGSSPRVRGKPHGPVLSGQERGLIPARAGKTPIRDTHSGRAAAHPRACGENPQTEAPTLFATGSSPRVRGKPGLRGHQHLVPGLIPARAGKTYRSHEHFTCNWAHPRACGENPPANGAVGGPSGSSPRVRGKPVHHHRAQEEARLIPARAGKTRGHRGVGGGLRAHPRACGENPSPMPVAVRYLGSSPRVRGKLVHRFDSADDGGLIPARAGKTD